MNRAGDYEAGAFHPAADFGAAESQTVAVHGDHGEPVALQLKEAAHVHRAALVGGDCEDGLLYQLAELLLLQAYGVGVVAVGQLGIVVGGQAHEAVLALAAAHCGLAAVRDLEGYHAVGQDAHHLAYELGGHDHGAAGLGHVGLEALIYTLAQVVAGHAHVGAGLDQQTLERGDGAARAGRARGGVDRRLEYVLFAGKFHFSSSSVRKKGYIFVVVIVGGVEC